MEARNQSSNVNYVIDGYIAGYDLSFFKTITGTDPTASSGLIPFNANLCTTRASFKYGDFEMMLKVPAVPTAGDNRIFGLVSPAMGLKGGVFFSIQGTAFKVFVYDNDGTALLEHAITWNAAWTNTETQYRIKWDRDVVEFWIAGTRYAAYRVDPTIQHRLNSYALPINITNLNADNMGLRYLAIRDARFVQSPATIGSGSQANIAVTADTEFPAAAALSDAMGNPTTTQVGAAMELWTGSAWRRATPSDLGGGGSSGGGNNTYSTEQGDFTATPTNGAKTIVLSVDTIGGATITAKHFANGVLKVWDASTDEMISIKLSDFTWTVGTKTLDVTNCQGVFTFATADIVSLTLVGPDKMRDSASDAQRVLPVRDVSDQYSGETLCALSNIAQSTTGYLYFPMDGYKYFALQCETSGTTPTDTLTLTVEATWQDDGTADSSCTYQDVTNAWFGVASVVDADVIFDKYTPCSAKHVRLKYVTNAGGGNDADLTVFLRRTY